MPLDVRISRQGNRFAALYNCNDGEIGVRDRTSSSIVGCRNSPASLVKLTEEFVNTTLSFSPSAATAAGLHSFQGQNLDDLLDEISSASLDRHRKFYGISATA